MIYADNAATTKLDTDAFEAMLPFLLEEYGNVSQPYSFTRSAKKALKEARTTIAQCIGALAEEIYFRECSATREAFCHKGLRSFPEEKVQGFFTKRSKNLALDKERLSK